MSKGDIRYHSGPFRIMHFPLSGSQTFVEGEPCHVTSTGLLIEAVDTPTGGGFLGFALASGDAAGATDPNGTFRYSGFGSFNPSSTLPSAGSGAATADKIPVLVPLQGALLIGRNKAAAYAQTDVGDAVGLDLSAGGVWTFDTAGTALGRIFDVLDVNGTPTSYSGAAGRTWLVTLNTNQISSTTAPV